MTGNALDDGMITAEEFARLARLSRRQIDRLLLDLYFYFISRKTKALWVMNAAVPKPTTTSIGK